MTPIVQIVSGEKCIEFFGTGSDAETFDGEWSDTVIPRFVIKVSRTSVITCSLN